MWPPRVLVCEPIGNPTVSVRPLLTSGADHDAKRAKGCGATLCLKECLSRQCPPSSPSPSPSSLIIIHHHHHQQQQQQVTLFSFLAHAACSALEAWAPNSCSADRACPRRNFAYIIEAKRARGRGAPCGRRTGIARGQLQPSMPTPQLLGNTANRAKGCCALCEYVLPVQLPGLFPNSWPRQRLDGAGRASRCGGSRR